VNEPTSDFTTRRRAQLAADPHLAPSWLTAVSCTGGGLSPDGRLLAHISDRDGFPELWLTEVSQDPEDLTGEVSADPADIEARAVRLETGPGHAKAVSWSPDGAWLACQLAPHGGEHTRVVVLRPDGTGLRELAGGARRAAELGSWRMDSGGLGISVAGPGAPEPTAYVVDPVTGERTRLVSGPAAQVCSFTPDGRFAVVRVGRRGARQLVVVHVSSGRCTPLLPTADTSVADARFSVDGSRLYVHTDCNRERSALLELPWDRRGPRRDTYPRHAVLAARRDADLDTFAVCGSTLAVVWNVAGRSELELIDPDLETGGLTHHRLRPPAEVIRSVSFAGDRSWLLVGAEGPARPPHLSRYRLRADDPTPCRVLPAPPAAPPATSKDTAEGTAGSGDWDELVEPTLLGYAAGDGLKLSGWWYPAAGVTGPAPTVLWLHGGPEAQERPTFAPLLQALAAAGLAVFAPNVRGSSGHGRRFMNADNHERRWAAIDDVAATVDYLVGAGLADPSRVACTGRSYGGYLTLASLVAHPELFRAGVDICGMSDLETFFAHTEPWIATAATTKYGDPGRDRALLRELSPLHRIDRLVAPLLVVHGEYDTNVPLVEARQVVDALRERGAAPSLLLFPDEGHEIHGITNRTVFVDTVVEWLCRHLLDAAEQTA
jgi:dipeptidyl aminopeptidase/acylaminoacyl peptidase